MVSKNTGGFKHVWRYQTHTYLWCGSRQIDVWFAWKISYLSMNHLHVHTNRDTNSWSNKKNKDSLLYTTEYPSKRNPTIKLRRDWPQTQCQTLTLSSLDKSSSQNHQRVWGPTRGRAIENRKQNCQPWLGSQPSMQSVAIHKCYYQSIYNEKLFWQSALTNYQSQ